VRVVIAGHHALAGPNFARKSRSFGQLISFMRFKPHFSITLYKKTQHF